MPKYRIKLSQYIADNTPDNATLDEAMQATGFNDNDNNTNKLERVNKDIDSNVNNLLSTDESRIDEETQTLVVNLNEITKLMSIKFFDMEISDIESLPIVQEILKDIANRVAHLPVQDVVDKIDDVLDKVDKIEESKKTPTPGNVGTGEQSTVPQVAQSV